MSRCLCTLEPRGRGGLNGFIRGEEYDYDLVPESKYKPGVKSYYRIHLTSNYWETCGPWIFARHFEVMEVTE